MSYLVHLHQFEGPLGLLLYLIRKDEMDIFDINVNEITRQYLEYIRMMKELDLEVAGEFVAMAATLIHIKSRMLLPHYNDEGETIEQEDPRKELVQRLLDYQKYQEAARRLYDRPLLGRDVFRRGVREDLGNEDSGEIITEEDGLFSLIASYRRVVRKAQRAVHEVRPKVQSIASRILEIKDRLVLGARVILRDLLTVGQGAPRVQLLVTFLSMLELGRMGFVSIFQNDAYGDIYIELRKPIGHNILERVQEFDAGDTEAVAKSMINDSINERIDERIDRRGQAMAEEAGRDSTPLGRGDAWPGSEWAVSGGPEALLNQGEFVVDMATDEDILVAEIEMGEDPEDKRRKAGVL